MSLRSPSTSVSGVAVIGLRIIASATEKVSQAASFWFNAASTSRKVSMPTMWPWSITTREPKLLLRHYRHCRRQILLRTDRKQRPALYCQNLNNLHRLLLYVGATSQRVVRALFVLYWILAQVQGDCRTHLAGKDDSSRHRT